MISPNPYRLPISEISSHILVLVFRLDLVAGDFANLVQDFANYWSYFAKLRMDFADFRTFFAESSNNFAKPHFNGSQYQFPPHPHKIKNHSGR